MDKSDNNWSAKLITKMVTSSTLAFDIAIQRGDVWDKKRQSLLIDSMLRKYYIPNIITIKKDEKRTTAKGEENTYDCIDGRQRCTAIYQFKTNQFRLTGLKPIKLSDGTEYVLEGKCYADLPEELKDEFDFYGITSVIYDNITAEEIADFMRRLNNGKPLTNVESSRITAKDLGKIIHLGNHRLFRDNLTEAAIRGYHNEDIVIKSYVLAYTEEPCLDNKVVRPFYEHQFTNEEMESLTRDFDLMLEVINIIRDLAKEKTIDKKILKKIIGKNNMLGAIDLIHSHKDDKGYENADMAEFVVQFFDSDEGLSISDKYNLNSMSGTGHIGAVKARREAMNEAYAEFMKE